MFGAPIPTDMDGRVLVEIFKPKSKNAMRKPEYTDANYYKRKVVKLKVAREDEKEPKQVYTPEEEEEVKERLRGLGYL